MKKNGTRLLYVTIPERIFEEMREAGLLKDVDMLVTNLMIDELLKKNGKVPKNEQDTRYNR